MRDSDKIDKKPLSALWAPQLAADLASFIPAGGAIRMLDPADAMLGDILKLRGFKVDNTHPDQEKTTGLCEYVVYIADIAPDMVHEAKERLNTAWAQLQDGGHLVFTAHVTANPEIDGVILADSPLLLYTDGYKYAWSVENLQAFLLEMGFVVEQILYPSYLNNALVTAIKLEEADKHKYKGKIAAAKRSALSTPASGTRPVSSMRYDQLNQIKYRRDLTMEEQEDYLSFMYYNSFGVWPNLQKPTTYNEKLNWLKIHYRNPKMHIIADKARFHHYALTRLPGFEKHCVKPLTIFHSPDELTNEVLEKLPERFIMKSNFGSGAQEFVTKKYASIGHLKRLITQWLKPETNHYYMALEWGYKDIPPAVLCEPIIDFEYKIEFYCFDGEPFIYWIVINDKTKDVHANLYLLNGEKLPISWHYPNFADDIPRPPYFDELVRASRALSRGFPHARVDFYAARDTWYFSEMTFFTWAGLMPFSDMAYDLLLGKKLHLENLEGI